MKKKNILLFILWLLCATFIISGWWLDYPNWAEILGNSILLIVISVQLFFDIRDLRRAKKDNTKDESQK